MVRGQLDPGYVLAEFRPKRDQKQTTEAMNTSKRFCKLRFLDTFSQLAHVLGGCENGAVLAAFPPACLFGRSLEPEGMVSFADFLAYYGVVSSTAGFE